jgi:integrase
LIARWQLFTGLRVSEVLSLTLSDTLKHDAARRSEPAPAHYVINVTRKGRKSGYVIATASLLEETAGYRRVHREAWLRRAARKHRASDRHALFVSNRGTAVKRNTYQKVMLRAGAACGFKATTHGLRATFACMLLARLEQLAKRGAAINPLLIVKILMAHEHIATTDRYLRAVAIDTCVLTEILESLLAGEHG